jgi:hypothetical protein
VVNTFLFSSFMHSIKAAMTPLPHEKMQRITKDSVARPRTIDYGRVDWRSVVARSRKELVPLMVAGWKLWPLVSVVNFAFIKSVEGRTLVGSLAGVVWGVYMSLFAAA